jgi:hypothetical protein
MATCFLRESVKKEAPGEKNEENEINFTKALVFLIANDSQNLKLSDCLSAIYLYKNIFFSHNKVNVSFV